ncbi:sigma factor-like helix-turn-helix DNA-binding protein [Pseudonocardia parietis]|uniref:RNA polymerase sigma-70 region 4 domain-containing protein n=1 Tax=Pseudonocardia parietis TaxID=570936 RepID=A0ABS4VXW1_9PSEU|nr:sigma factor-like helix-turn-helix DNA-binding protein [Pseudonocardia parietis]MBP2368787.1 hypothetical protein [Pseudonocardia parietis]
MSTYTVDVNREDGLWSAIVNDLPGGAFVGLDFERFSDIRDGVQEALIDFFGTEEFALEWTFATDHRDFTRPLQEALDQAAVAERARARLDHSRREAIATMRGAGLSYQEIGDALSLSKARVSQIHHAATEAGDRSVSAAS